MALALYANLWRLLQPFIKGHGRSLAVAYLLSFVGIVGMFGAPWFLAAMLDHALPARNRSLFLQYAVAILISLAVFFLCSLLKSYLLAGTSERIFFSLRRRLASALLRKPAHFFAKHETADLITRVSNDTEFLSLLFFDYILASLSGLMLIVLFVAMMLAWQWRLGLYTLLTLPCYVFLLSFTQRSLSRAAKTAREQLSEQNNTLLDHIGGVKDIRFYQQFEAADRRFAAAADGFTAANIRSVLIGEWSYNTMELFSRLITIVPFLLGGYWICYGTASVTIGTLIAYNLYLSYIAYALEMVNVGIIKLGQAMPLIDRNQEILAYPEEECGKPEAASDITDSIRIEFQNVCFSYDGATPVLKDFRLSVEPGEKVALMGPSGAGKSTIIDLLTRQIEPQQGTILLGERAIQKYNLPLYLLHFAYVRQRPYIFKTSIEENIASGWYEIPMHIIIDAAKRVRLHDDIIKLPHGYETLIGMHGVDLSLGQQQRLTLARALVREPAILLLDEFTSALDRKTEEEILDDLFLNFQRQTIICVTHSKAVAGRFSKIVEIEKL
ncbi:MAG: ABC transporter ATP-binding protein [Desulfobacteraceae bacterium]|nr:MAG: ABC transporter ATP-binding protein [Desulfobacteraceae bacterium]